MVGASLGLSGNLYTHTHTHIHALMHARWWKGSRAEDADIHIFPLTKTRLTRTLWSHKTQHNFYLYKGFCYYLVLFVFLYHYTIPICWLKHIQRKPTDQNIKLIKFKMQLPEDCLCSQFFFSIWTFLFYLYFSFPTFLYWSCALQKTCLLMCYCTFYLAQVQGKSITQIHRVVVVIVYHKAAKMSPCEFREPIFSFIPHMRILWQMSTVQAHRVIKFRLIPESCY